MLFLRIFFFKRDNKIWPGLPRWWWQVCSSIVCRSALGFFGQTRRPLRQSSWSLSPDATSHSFKVSIPNDLGSEPTFTLTWYICRHNCRITRLQSEQNEMKPGENWDLVSGWRVGMIQWKSWTRGTIDAINLMESIFQSFWILLPSHWESANYFCLTNVNNINIARGTTNPGIWV